MDVVQIAVLRLQKSVKAQEWLLRVQKCVNALDQELPDNSFVVVDVDGFVVRSLILPEDIPDFSYVTALTSFSNPILSTRRKIRKMSDEIISVYRPIDG